MQYAIVIEKAESNYSAYAPDVPGCIATGTTVEEVKRNSVDALRFHFDGMRADGESVPSPVSSVDYVEVFEPARRAAS